MPLPLPVLDRRTWAELVAEARALLPAYGSDWTDYNYHDPGITLVELFAWLSELLVFRSDRIPPGELRAFLRWFGVVPEPAQPAAAVLALEIPSAAATQTVAAGMKVADPTTALVFETDDPVLVSPAWIELSDEGTQRGRIYSQAAGAFTELSASNCRPGPAMSALGPAPGPGDALWIGFDCLPAKPGDVLSLQIWTASWSTDADVRARLIAEEEELRPCSAPVEGWDTRTECLEAGAPPPSSPKPSAPSWPLHYSARVTWEGWDGTAWLPLDVIADETRALALTGPVRLQAGTLAPDPPDAPESGYWWLRCRLVSGGYECPPQLAGIALNAVRARHAATVLGPKTLGVSRGQARETYLVDGRIVEQGPHAIAQPLLSGTLALRLLGAGPPDDSWVEVPDWDRSGPFDRHFVIDPADNSIIFGDGRIGRVPPAGAGLEARSYRVGGGPAGNLPARSLTDILAAAAPPLLVRQPFDATGGTAAETLDQAHARAVELLASPARGITIDDWETLARDVPGIPVGRATAIAPLHPDFSCWNAPGVVTVVVLPECGDPPMPGPDFLAGVTRYLGRRRPLTTELHVVGPRYVKVTVSATLHVRAASPDIAVQAQDALDAFFDPLHGGPVDAGWPFGRGVLESDLLAILASLPGVAYVDQLGIAADGSEPRCQNLALCPTDLVDSQTHQFVVVET